MTFPPDIIPIEMRGMSIFTALVFTFIAIGFWFIWGTMRKELKDINNRLDSHSKKLDERREDITDIKVNIAKMQISIENIEEIMKKIWK